ncbi:hypothetical protein EWB00_000804 [Schistosoma japonicum]|uniref:Uncharacterized protein n=1 Tax=Schistosoma japonicum TaxID=6182 RepID=A0A4Z2DHT6_SCHJA|nr:hypothetical protein EWB00_000804 [Schistosoma japonicum]TNN16046.1 hypothetical protein EWB00_000804 [Schistosoma japonicum]
MSDTVYKTNGLLLIIVILFSLKNIYTSAFINGNPLKRTWVYSDTYNCEKIYSCFNTRQCRLRYNSPNYFCANMYPCGSSCAPLEYHGRLRSYEIVAE